MVCVTQQESCSRLIEAGARIAKEENLPLSVISVFKESKGMNANSGGALEELFICAQKYNASMNVYFNDSPSLVVAVAAKNEDYYITGNGVSNQISNYDRIVLNAKDVKDDDILV